MKANSFFSKEEKERISNTIKSIENRTIGEIAVMVVDKSDEYREADVLGGITFSSIISFVVTVYFFHSSLWWYIPLNFIVYLPLQLIFRAYPKLKIVFMNNKRKETAVMQRAIRAFYEKGLYKTRQNTGILFFISLLERKVWVLADKGIYEKIKQEKLNSFAAKVSHGIKEGCACESLCEAIIEAGNLLALYFPITPDDINELSDEILTDK